MKLAVVGVAAFVVGVAGGTVLSPARRALPVDTTQVAADTHTEGGDSTAVEPPTHLAPVTEADSEATEHATVPPETAPTPASSSTAEIQALMAAIAKLPPADAGPMVARLSDADALAVLKSVPLPQASKILDTMPPVQAARLSKQLLLAGATP